jgi:hypothetical protein
VIVSSGHDILGIRRMVTGAAWRDHRQFTINEFCPWETEARVDYFQQRQGTISHQGE